jgi:metallophosphoesterase superfamily enzyme
VSLTGFQIDDRIHLDARRAAWLPLSRCLAVADLHLGEAWVRRARGQLVPLGVVDTTVSRLRSLMEAYRPERVILLGDIVHGALPLEGIREAVGDLVALGREGVRIHWCLGNHDRNLPRQLERWGWSVDTAPRVILPEAILDHGDRPPEPWSADPAAPGWHLHGHLHPALMLDDGVASRAKVPCFLIARARPGRPARVVLPAFSEMAAGSVVDRRGVPQGLGSEDRFDSAVACLGPRLLRIPFEG